MNYIGIDLGGTKITGAVFNEDGNIIHKITELLNGEEGKAVGNHIISIIKKLLNYSNKKLLKPKGIGVCVPGISNTKTQRVWAPNIPGWENYPLEDEIINSINSKEINVKVDSDRTCYILGELWLGAARGCTNAIYLSVGTGIAAGIFTDGKVLHGKNDIGGAIGWMALKPPYTSDYNECGSFETYASGTGIALQARNLLKNEINYSGILKSQALNDITSHDVFDALEQGDEIAKKVIKQAIMFWGMGTANLVSIFNPEKIIFGGGVFGPATKFIDDIKTEAEKWAQPISIKQVEFCPTQVEGDAGVIGAGYLAMRNQ